MPSTIVFVTSEERISDFDLSLAMFHMSNSCTHNAAHRKENSIAADTQGESHNVHVVVHASAHNILNPLEILAEEEAIETCDQSSVGIDQGVDC